MKVTCIRLCLLATSSLALAQPALAQTAKTASSNANAPQVLEDVVVTARRVEERLQDVPISITVFNQDQLTQQNIVNAEDLARYTPSLSANSSFGSDNSTFAIRGFVQDIGTAPSVGVYFADVVAPRGGSPSFSTGDGAGPGSYFDLQNVQVLKGPQGTLFGRNTTGGAVLLVPRKPSYEFEGYVEGSVGNYDMRRLQAVINAPLGDKVRARLSLDRQVRDGWLKNTSGIGPSDFSNIDYWAVRGSVVVDITPNLENYVIVSYNKSKTNGPLEKVIACDPNTGLGGFACGQMADAAAKGEGFYTARSDLPGPESNLKSAQIINTTTWSASDNVTVKNIISYAELKQTLRTALFGTQFATPPVPALNLPSFPFNFATIVPAPNANGAADQSTFTEELQLQGRSGDNRLTWQAGAYYEYAQPIGLTGSQSPNTINCTSIETLQCTDILGFLANLDPNVLPLVIGGVIPPIQAGSVNYTVGKLKTRSIGTYAQASYDLNAKLRLTGGIRYTWDRQESRSEQISYRFPTFPFPAGPATAYCLRPNTVLPACSLALEQKSSAPTWMVDLDYKPYEDLLLYAKYARGYRTGGIKSDAPTAYSIFRPEKVDNYEVGLKTSFKGRVPGTFNVAAFYNDFSDQQLQVGFGDNPAVAGSVSATAGPVNAGQSRIYGLELEAGVRPFTGFALNLGYSYLNTEIKSITPVTLPASDPYVVTSEVAAGDELALAPKHKLVLSASYRLPVAETLGKISLGATFSHVSSQRSSYASLSPASLALTGGVDIGVLPSLDLLNLNIDWKQFLGSRVDLAVFATNVTKEQYYTYVPGLFSTAGFEIATLGEPRMIGARLRVGF
ncbi:TonB-dependent receptor [Caulobacter soli]|uniref:TonB-dependent receptor n=1 Tax=Caulobacter soli TaxID=2708539 RepID=UPI0013EAE868|nr:TonB-dependent receptor [Caulobacter soli]